MFIVFLIKIWKENYIVTLNILKYIYLKIFEFYIVVFLYFESNCIGIVEYLVIVFCVLNKN